MLWGHTDVGLREDMDIGRSREGLSIPTLKGGVFHPSPAKIMIIGSKAIVG
jgi:hypothetical protein